MKTFLFSISFCFLFSVATFGQTAPRLQKYLQYVDNFHTGEYQLEVETSYEYNEFGEIQERIQKFYNQDGTVKNLFGNFYTYNEQNLLEQILQQRYNADVDLWISTVWLENQYNDLGCLIQEKRTRNVGGLYEVVDYERDDACRETKQTIWRDLDNTPGVEIRFVYEWEYMPDGISYIRKNYRRSTSDTMYLTGVLHYLYNEDDNLIERYQIGLHEDQDTFFFNKILYEYDEHKNRTTWLKYVKYSNDEDWLLNSQFFYHNQYDENDFLIEVKTEELHFTNSAPPTNDPYDEKLFNYEYTCDGLEKVRTVVSYQTQNTYKYESFYEGFNECFEIEDIDLKVKIHPNPTNRFLNIESPILASGNTEIIVFSIDGKVLLQKTEISRCEQMSFDLGSDLPSGIYLIELSNQDHHVIEKLILQR